MSGSRFASITASLLARKGEAEPWHEPLRRSWRRDELPAPASQPVPETAAIAEAKPKRAPRAARHAPGDGRDKKCAVRMTSHDYERLGIIAVKKGTSRQQLLQLALEEFFQRIAGAYAQDCACLQAGRTPDCNPACQQPERKDEA